VRDRETNVTERVSLSSAGAQGNAGSYFPALSANGRYVALASDAGNLVSGDTNATMDVFVRDRETNTTRRVSVTTGGIQGNGESNEPGLTADGSQVVFTSSAHNLATGDTNGTYDVFVRDLDAGITERVSVASSGTGANERSTGPAISADGRYVSFNSRGDNLVAGDTNGMPDVFVRDRQSGAHQVITRASVSSDGVQGDDDSLQPVLSADGRYVAFQSAASTLVPGGTNGADDIFVRDRQTGLTERVSVTTAGTQLNEVSAGAAISADGRYVAFNSYATNVVPGDANGWTTCSCATGKAAPPRE
jgi:Tol biopolymer transport system component